MPADLVLTTDHRTPTFSPDHAPAGRVAPGSTVAFETGDLAYRRLANGESVDAIGLENFNLVTGPVYVDGAQPGDVLRVDVLDVDVERAWSVWMPEFGGLGAHTDDVKVRRCPIEGDRVRIGNDLTVPLAPMIGCIGTAPAEGTASTFSPAHPTGGNMDLREMSPGATVFLPVQTEGALLSVGDLHAAMGRAEPTWVGLEAAGRARVRLDLAPDMSLSRPRLHANGAVYFVAYGDTLDDAHQQALDRAYTYLTDERDLDPFDAYAYASARVHMTLGGPACPMVLAKVGGSDEE